MSGPRARERFRANRPKDIHYRIGYKKRKLRACSSWKIL